MNVITKGFIAAAIVTSSALSHASGPIYYTVNGGATQQLDVTPIADTFEGETRLSAGFLCQVTCDFSADGVLSDVIGGLTTLTVTGGSVSGSNPLCGLISLSGFDWVGSVPHPSSITPITFTLDNVSVSASICGTCNGSIDVTFDPANGASFEFDDNISGTNCNVDGTLTSANGNYYVAWK